MTTNHRTNKTSENHDGCISATLAGSGRPAQDFVNQLYRLIAHLAAAEHREAVRAGIERHRARIIHTDTGGSHDE